MKIYAIKDHYTEAEYKVYDGEKNKYCFVIAENRDKAIQYACEFLGCIPRNFTNTQCSCCYHVDISISSSFASEFAMDDNLELAAWWAKNYVDETGLYPVSRETKNIVRVGQFRILHDDKGIIEVEKDGLTIWKRDQV